jgi:hypothetical protein
MREILQMLVSLSSIEISGYLTTNFADFLQYFLCGTKIKLLNFKKKKKKVAKKISRPPFLPGTLHPPHADAREYRGLAEAKRGRRHQIRGQAQDATGRAERSH